MLVGLSSDLKIYDSRSLPAPRSTCDLPPRPFGCTIPALDAGPVIFRSKDLRFFVPRSTCDLPPWPFGCTIPALDAGSAAPDIGTVLAPLTVLARAVCVSCAMSPSVLVSARVSALDVSCVLRAAWASESMMA